MCAAQSSFILLRFPAECLCTVWPLYGWAAVVVVAAALVVVVAASAGAVAMDVATPTLMFFLHATAWLEPQVESSQGDEEGQS